ncbi:MAG TPA: phosphotransferase [Candidatus Limnocylindria bacterium]
MTPDSDIPWLNADWRAEALAWADAVLADRGVAIAGEVEQPHAVWWSTALRIPTSDGPVWLKAMQPQGVFEVRLTPWLAACWPERTVEVIAVAEERGWMLSRDAGTRLREATDRPPVEHWTRLLPRYAEIQIAAAAHRDDLLALGVPDRSPKQLASDLRATLDEPESLMLGQEPDGLSAEDHARARASVDGFAGDCGRLVEMGIPDTIQHDDLHDGNAFRRGGDYVVFDWGDACISHPFHTLAVTLRALAYSHKWAPGGSAISRLIDAYLEPWTGQRSPAELREALKLARRTGTIGRAMAWRSYAQAMPPAVRVENIDAVPYGIRLWLADAPWGTWDDGTF